MQSDLEAAALFNPGFDVPFEHQHAMRGMTEQHHKVTESATYQRGQPMILPPECPGMIAHLSPAFCLACMPGMCGVAMQAALRHALLGQSSAMVLLLTENIHSRK